MASVGKKKASGMCHHSTRPNSTHSFRGKHVNGILPQHVHSLSSGDIETVARLLGVVDRRVEKLRTQLGLNGSNGGDRRSERRFENYQPFPAEAPTHIKLVGDGIGAVLIVSAKPTAWQRIPQSQILYEGNTAGNIKQWLSGVSNHEAASALGLSYNKIRGLRLRFNAPSPHLGRIER